VTGREAVEVLLAGYGDDCPSYGDEYLEALMVLADLDLIDWNAVERHAETRCRWPRPEPRVHWLVEEYANNVRVSMSEFPTLTALTMRRRP